MYRVDLDYWEHGYGHSHVETFDNIETYCSATEYIESFDLPLEIDNRYSIIVKIYDGNNVLISECTLKK